MNPDPLLAAFDRLVTRSPERVLLVRGDRRVRAAQLDGLARAAGRVLSGALAGAPAGAVVGLQAVNGTGALAALLALRRAGHAALLLDPQTPARERDRVAAGLGARVVLRCDRPLAREAGDFTLDPLPAAEIADTAPVPVPPPGTAVIKLTSGSTGAARGIATPSRALIRDEAQLFASMALHDRDRLLAAIPFSHSYGLSSLVMPALVRGLPLILPAAEDPFAPLRAAAAAEATVFPTVPAFLGAWTRLADPPPLPPTVRLVLAAGAPLPAATSARFRRRFDRPVHVFYGASESGGICYDREGGAAERGTVGTPVDGVEVALAPSGRVAVRSPAVADGYLPPAPERLAGGRFLTDDLGAWRGGELALTGRLNELINVRGRKVDPREVEAVLAALEGVEDALVTAAPGTDGGQHVRAVVACRPRALTRRQVIAHCRHHLADYKAPRSVVLLPALPRTARGKIDRAAIAALEPEPVAARSPD